MTSLRSTSYNVLGTVLGSAVADDGTFTVAYPSGTTQGDFDKGLADLANSYVFLNNNDKVVYADPGINLAFGASEITVTNRTGASWAAGTEVDLHLPVKSGNRRCLVIPVPPMAGWTAADIITEMQPGIAGDLEYAEFVQTVAVTTASDAATLNFEIGTTDVTGMTLALTSANATPKGKVHAFGLPTAGYTLTRASKLSLEASSVTAFAEGEGYINLYIREAFPDQY
jgi:hypothetical protein